MPEHELVILFKNQISSIDSETFSHLTKLKFLDSRYNNFIEIHPTTFIGLHSLKILFLSSNRIESLCENLLAFLNAVKVL